MDKQPSVDAGELFKRIHRDVVDAFDEEVERTLREHGIQVENLGAASRRSIEQFTLTKISHAEQAFQGHHATSIEGRFERRDVDVPTGSLLVRTKQPLGRLAFYLLEPESDDGLTTWNSLDSGLKVGHAHPILKAVEVALHESKWPGTSRP